MTFEDTIAAWLPAQRWYPGQDPAIGDLTITADTTVVPGDPELRHLIVTVAAGGEAGRYQLFVGIRERLPEPLLPAVIGPAPGSGTAYDALHDPALARVLLDGMAEQRVAGPLQFGLEPAAVIETGLDSVVLAREQSNTSLIFGDSVILKVLRRLFPGCNPDLEVTSALARRGSRHVAVPLGRIETRLDGAPVLLAMASRYLPAATDGWSLAAASLRQLYAGESPGGGPAGPGRTAGTAGAAQPGQPGSAGRDFADEADELGAATAEIHADLAAEFGTGELGAAALSDLARQMTGRLEQAATEVGELRRHSVKLRAYYAELASLSQPLPVQRIHGDYHLGQVLRTPAGWVALDFEGEPASPLAQRRAASPTLRDVAGMLRSFDYAARHQLLGRTDAEELRSTAEKWAQRSQAAFCAGYARAGGIDPQANAALLRALMLDKAVYEVVYEARHRPAWLAIPLGSIAAALRRS